MSLHERTATFRSPASNRQAGGDRNEEQGRQPIARSSSGAMGGGSEGRELHERFPTTRIAVGSSDQVSLHIWKRDVHMGCSDQDGLCCSPAASASGGEELQQEALYLLLCAQGDTALQLSQNGEDYPLKADRGLKQAVSPSFSESEACLLSCKAPHCLGTLRPKRDPCCGPVEVNREHLTTSFASMLHHTICMAARCP